MERNDRMRQDASLRISRNTEDFPLVFDIKRCSTNDGPGIRTVIFLKGCNLNCYWCHNPEGKHSRAENAFFAEKCTHCGVCRRVCPSPKGCTDCGLCATLCPAEARKHYGKPYTAEELLENVLSDREYYRATGGGVTFSGGECMLYPQFVAETAKLCKDAGLSVAIDTAGAVPYSHFESVLPYADLFLYDIKCLDSELHRCGTGRGNERILENLERLRKTGKQIIIRTPVIPQFNDGEEIERVKAYCRERALPHELLSYHAMGESKREALEAFSASNA